MVVLLASDSPTVVDSRLWKGVEVSFDVHLFARDLNEDNGAGCGGAWVTGYRASTLLTEFLTKYPVELLDRSGPKEKLLRYHCDHMEMFRPVKSSCCIYRIFFLRALFVALTRSCRLYIYYGIVWFIPGTW